MTSSQIQKVLIFCSFFPGNLCPSVHFLHRIFFQICLLPWHVPYKRDLCQEFFWQALLLFWHGVLENSKRTEKMQKLAILATWELGSGLPSFKKRIYFTVKNFSHYIWPVTSSLGGYFSLEICFFAKTAEKDTNFETFPKFLNWSNSHNCHISYRMF